MYRNIDSTYSKAPEGRQVETVDVTPFNIRSLGAVLQSAKQALNLEKRNSDSTRYNSWYRSVHKIMIEKHNG